MRAHGSHDNYLYKGEELPNASLIDLLTYERGRIATICLVVGETKERTKEITPGKALFEMQPAYKKLL